MKPSLLIKGNLVHTKAVKQRLSRPDTVRPIDYVSDYVTEQYESTPKCPGDKILILKSGTGSGKSTTVPPELFRKIGRNIAVSQPRVLTTIDIPRDIVQIPDYAGLFQIEKNIGFMTGNFKRPPKERGITFMTIGILLQQLQHSDPIAFGHKYGLIILDEIHVRSIDLDATLYFIKQYLLKHWKNEYCPFFVMMSATFDPKPFMDYFGISNTNYIEVKGFSHPIEARFAPYDVLDAASYAATKAIELHEANPGDFTSKIRDIIIFVHGGQFAIEISKQFDNYNETLAPGRDNYIIPIILSSEVNKLGGRDYINVFSKIEMIKVAVRGALVTPKRRIIISTNVAETGITIETLKYCVDTGLVFSSEFNPDYCLGGILTKTVTRAEAEQRRGRVGRKAPGVWCPCFTQKSYNDMPAVPYSDMLTNDISEFMLSTVCSISDAKIMPAHDNFRERIGRIGSPFQLHRLYSDTLSQFMATSVDVEAIDFFEWPGASAMLWAIEKNKGLGFIDGQMRPTLFGFYANKLPKISLECRRLILAGYVHGAHILDLITISAFVFVSYKSIFKRGYTPRTPVKCSDSAVSFACSSVYIADEFIDAIFVWDEFLQQLEQMNASILAQQKKISPDFRSIQRLMQWCEDQNLNYSALLQVAQMRDEILSATIGSGLNPYFNGLGLPKGQYNLAQLLSSSAGKREIMRFKRCIADGFCFNLLYNTGAWRRVYPDYPVTLKSPLINIECDFDQQSKPITPQYLVSGEISYDAKRRQFVAASPISVLDGFVDVDSAFCASI